MLRPAVPNVFVRDFPAALAHYTGPLGFRPLFVYGEPAFYAHVARDEAVLALRHVTRPVIDHSAGEALLSAFIEVDTSMRSKHRFGLPGRRFGNLPVMSPGRCGV